MKCDARQYSDMMGCPCGNRWDVNDPCPPTCGSQLRKHIRDRFECSIFEAAAMEKAYRLRKQLESAKTLDDLKVIIAELIPPLSDKVRAAIDSELK